MQLPVALFALAFSLTAAQNADNTPVPNICSEISPAHHAPVPNDCQKFYNCNPVGAGFLLSCPNGVIYNDDTKVCDYDATCPSWIAQCQTQFNNGLLTFPTQCCKTYFTVDCSTNAYSLNYCPDGQRWDSNNRQCTSLGNAASLQCQDCVADGEVADRCAYTHLTKVDNCRFGYVNTDASVISRCPVGTVFSDDLCTCAYSGDLNSCATTTQDCSEQSRNRLNLASDGTFTVPFMETPVQTVTYTAGPFALRNGGGVAFTSTSSLSIPYFGGNSLAHWMTGFALRMEFTLQDAGQTSTSIPIMTNNDGCTSTGAVVSLNAEIVNSFGTRTIRFVFSFTNVVGTVYSRTLTSQATNYNAGSSYRVTVSGEDDVLSGRVVVNGQAGGLMTAASSGTVQKPFTATLKCALKIGEFAGVLTSFDTWRCPGAAVLL